MRYFLIALFLTFTVNGAAQRVEIGNILPVIELSGMLNYNKGVATLQEFNNNKPMLIQFWGTGCSASVSSLKKLDSIQQQFAGRLNILLVTSDAATTTAALLKEKQVTLPCVAEDSLLVKKYFPYMSIPHEVWVGADGRVKAITGYEELTISNIEKLASGEPLALKEKRDATSASEYWVFDPLISYNYDRYKGDVLSYSFLAGPRDGITYSSRYPNNKDSIKRIKMINTPLKRLYQVANGKQDDHASLVELRINKPANSQQEYCYDMILKTHSTDSFYKRMRDDLDRHFGTTSRVEKRMVLCYVLHVDTAKGLVRSKYKKREKIDREGETEYRAIGLWVLHSYLGRHEIPFINELPRSKSIDITLPSDLSNFEMLQERLAAAGIKFIKEERLMEVVVIK